MATNHRAAVGIVPVGALGVAFFHHLTHELRKAAQAEVVFLARRGGTENERWRRDAHLHVEVGPMRVEVPLANLLAGDLAAAAGAGALPEIVLVCTNPDQLFDVLADFVAVVEHEHRAGRLMTGEARLPALVVCANGIYFQRIRRSFVELLEEATLLGRLPDLWPDVMPAVVGRLMRGVTIQTAVRRGSGSDAVYRPGPRARTLLTGGDRALRAAAAAKLTELGGWFEDAGTTPPTRVEFDKALVNLAANVFGQLAAIDANGNFRVRTVGEIVSPQRHGHLRRLVEAMMRIGRGVGVYSADETVDAVFADTLARLAPAAEHVPSSVQWIEQQLATRSLRPGLTPTEMWLLKPLQHYARSLGDAEDIVYFEGLEAELTQAIARVVAAQGRGGAEGVAR